MDTAIHSALWTLVSTVGNTTIGWAMAAAGPAFAVMLAAGLGIGLWRELFESPEEIEEREEIEMSEAMGSSDSEGFNRFMANHREDMIDTDDD